MGSPSRALMEGWKDGRMEGDLLEALCSERCGGMLFYHFSHTVTSVRSFSLLPLKLVRI
jgi:hypothetical protein